MMVCYAAKLNAHLGLRLDAGHKEGRRTVHDVEHLNRRLKANGWQPGETLHFEKAHGGTHDEASWARRVMPMLRFLFPQG